MWMSEIILFDNLPTAMKINKVKEQIKKTKYPIASAIFNQKVKLSRNELLTSSFDQFLIEYAYAYKARKLLKYTISVNWIIG